MLWTSTAMMLVPFWNTLVGRLSAIGVFSAAPVTSTSAFCVKPIAPPGRLARPASTPLMYTTAPSSRTALSVAEVMLAASATSNRLRK